MSIAIELATEANMTPLRVRYRAEANEQIVHDSIHQRKGWTRSYLLLGDGRVIGFGSVAIDGPWKDKPTVFEFYVLPKSRGRVFDLFEAFVSESGARFFEVQTSNRLLAVMIHNYGSEIESESIVFRDELITSLDSPDATLKRITSEEESMRLFHERSGQSCWQLELNGDSVGEGSILFHYNHPFCDLSMNIAEEYRRRGLGAYLVQELKRLTYEMGGIPAARCNPSNTASKKTLQKAGFVPYAHILVGKIASKQA